MTRLVALLMPGATVRSRHIFARNTVAARGQWVIVASGILEPFFYLLSVGVGVSVLVGDVQVGGRTYDYTTFVAPAMLASAAMSGAIAESTYNTYGKLKWDKLYDGLTATPLTPSDIAFGELLYAQARGSMYSVIFLLAMVVLGLVQSWWALLALPAVILIGVAFSAAGLAAATYLRTWEDFDLVLLVQVSLFLFSATFYPLSVYPEPLQLIARLSPLYHGVTLCRDLILGNPGWNDLAHVAVLVFMAVAGLRLAGHRFASLLHD
ncbi:MAG: ABC transporter permease [Acidimicrobiales bacterium]